MEKNLFLHYKMWPYERVTQSEIVAIAIFPIVKLYVQILTFFCKEMN